MTCEDCGGDHEPNKTCIPCDSCDTLHFLKDLRQTHAIVNNLLVSTFVCGACYESWVANAGDWIEHRRPRND